MQSLADELVIVTLTVPLLFFFFLMSTTLNGTSSVTFHTTQWRCNHVCQCAGGLRMAWERMSVATSILSFMPHTKAFHLQLATFFITSRFLKIISSSYYDLILKVIFFFLMCQAKKRDYQRKKGV